MTQQCGHDEQWTAYRNPVDAESEQFCLFCEVERLRQAVKILYAGTIQGHSAHWDNEGTHGANCPACKSARLHREAAAKCLGYVPDSFFLDEAAEAARSEA